MTHYVCTGSCGNEANSPGVCESQFCSKEGKPLSECSCEDHSHTKINDVPEGEDIAQ
ncbi:MAG: hypothetical protein V4467_04710 [Patescibacteria group bacterium]